MPQETLQNVHEHLNCRFYATEDTAFFHYLKLQAGESLPVNTKSMCLLFYLESGSIEAVIEGFELENVSEKHLVFIPINSSFQGRCLEDVELVTCNLSVHIPLCAMYDLLDLQKDMKKMHGGKLPKYPHKFPKLPANDTLEIYFSNLEKFLKDGLGCIIFQDIKRQELMALLRAYYTKQELYDLFYSVIGKETGFREFVIRTYTVTSDVKDLAARANMNLRSFQRRFKTEFGCSARDWLLDRKAESIFVDLSDSDKTFYEIAIEHGFSTASSFTNFCKSQLHMTPTEIRTSCCVSMRRR